MSSPHALRIVIGAALYLTVCGLLGVALGALLRSTAAAITALTGLLFILPILMNFLPVSWHRDQTQRRVQRDRAALEDVRRIGDKLLPRRQHRRDRRVQGTVEDDALRPFLIVLQHEHDTAPED